VSFSKLPYNKQGNSHTIFYSRNLIMGTEQAWYVKYTVTLTGLILTVFVMIMAKSILIPLLFALLLSILLSPVCTKLESFKIPRVFSVIITILISFLMLGGLIFLFYSQLTAFAEDIDLVEKRIRELIAGFNSFLDTWFGMSTIIEVESLEQSLFDVLRSNISALTSGIAGAASILTATFLVPIYVFLILLFRDFLNEFILKIFASNDKSDRQSIRDIIGKIKNVVQYYISGVTIVILILAVLNSAILMIIGIKHAIFFGVFAALLNIIPFLGPIIGSIFPILFSLLTMDSLIYPVLILFSFYVIQMIEGNLLTPMIVGSQVSMNALVAIILLFTGAQIWGLAGMILFIPLGAMAKVIFDEIDSLKPFGFLMGKVPDSLNKKRGPIAKKIRNITQKSATEDENSG